MSLLSAVAPIGDTPIDVYLSRQSDLSAVEIFAKRHDTELEPRQVRYYRDLIPLGRPQPGQQYGFEVDLDACTGCKACVAACHSLNGLDGGESWRTVTVLRSSDRAERPFQQTVTAGCHHCVDPACMKGCPVDAYEKDPVTGIVVHLDDQCIGCGYCTLSCPYEVPSFNRRQGIVRKCDMCHGRLAAGEAPACVQACPNGAISIAIVDVAAASAAATTGTLVPGAPPSSITTPTTVYRTATGRIHDQPVAATVTAGPAHAHPPLAVMLVLTQLSVGAFVLGLVLRVFNLLGSNRTRTSVDAALAVAGGIVALGASVLHLGRPRYCYRAVIGFRHSWLSREVVAFGAFTGLATLYAFGLMWGDPPFARPLLHAVGGLAAVCGVAGVACSVLIYSTTHRSSWRTPAVTAKFAFTMAMCGAAAVAWAAVLSGSPSPARPVFVGLIGFTVLKLGGEGSVLRHLRPGGDSEGAHRARLLVGDLRTAATRRFALGATGGIALPLVTVAVTAGVARPGILAVVLATLVLTATVAGELLERSLFFTTASPPR